VLLLLFVFGHMAATRGVTLWSGADAGFGAVSFSLHWLPAWFGRISARRRVPVNATVFAAILIWLLAGALPIDILARSTSSVTFIVFALINAGLLVLPKTPAPDTPVFIVPRWVCVLGLAGNLGLLGFQISRLWSIG